MAPLPSGIYTLFSYNGSLTGGAADLAMGGAFLSNRQTYSFSASAGTVSLTVNGSAANLQWTGGNNQTWDTTTSKSWFNLSTSTADFFFTGDNVTFNDAAGTANANVTISGGTLGNVQPGSVTVSNTAVNYTFGGDPIAGATSLVKKRSRQLDAGQRQQLHRRHGAQRRRAQRSAVNSLGSGPLTISGGSLSNTSGSPITLSGNALNLNGSFVFAGSNPLNTGVGPVTLAPRRRSPSAPAR